MKRGRGRAKPSLIPPPTPVMDHRQYGGGRDSDASFASSRPSSVGIGRSTAVDLISDRSYQQSAIRAVNSYLASRSFPIHIRSTLPSAKDITSIFNFVISQLDYPNPKMEEDLPILLKSLNCPFKISKSALRTPATPHAWPTFVAVLHWLVQIAMYGEHLVSGSGSFAEANSMHAYTVESYLQFIRGDDDAVEALDREFMAKLEQERDNAAEKTKARETEVKELERTEEELRTGKTEREKKEIAIAVVEEDVKKFNTIIAEFTARNAVLEKALEEKEKQLRAKEDEDRRICEENEELKKAIQLQRVNSRDAERMNRELKAVEREIAEAETERSKFEEKCWDLDATLGRQFKELEELAMQCNNAIRKLKLGGDFQYVLNTKGGSPAEVMGIDYKLTLKPALDSYADDINKSSIGKLDELMTLQQVSKEISAKMEEKRNRILSLHSRVEEFEDELDRLKKEAQDFVHRCVLEAKEMAVDIEVQAHDLTLMETEAAEMRKTTELKLREATREGEEEIQKCAAILFLVVDSVSKYKELMESKTSEMKISLYETAKAISEAHRASLPAQIAQSFEPNK